MPWGGRCFFLRRRSNSPATEAARWFPRPRGRGSLPRISTRTRPRGARGGAPPRLASEGSRTVPRTRTRSPRTRTRAAASARPRGSPSPPPPRPLPPRRSRRRGRCASARCTGTRRRTRASASGSRTGRTSCATTRRSSALGAASGRRVAASAPNFPRGFSTSSRASTGATSWTATSYGSGSRTSRTGARASSPRSTPGRRASSPRGCTSAALWRRTRGTLCERWASSTCSTARTIWRTRTRTRRS